MTTTILDEARKTIKGQFGEAFAQKTSDAFCMSFARRFMATPAAFTTETMPIAASNAILEFENESVGSPTKDVIGNAVSERIKMITETLPAMPKALEYIVAKEEVRKLRHAFKESTIQKVQLISNYLEQKMEKSFSRDTRSLNDQPFLTQLCWLNQTMRTIPDYRSLAEVAEDKLIKAIDIPRKLSKEIDATGTGLFATQYRNRFAKTGKDIRIAVIDSEVSLRHPALADRVVQSKNYTKEPWGNPDAHGTAVAGIIGSAGPRYVGMAPDATIHNYKVLATDKELNADDFEGSLAIQNALEDGMQIANCSWGGGLVGAQLSREAKACDNAWNFGLTIVKSAGNRGAGAGTLTTPAEAQGIIVVGATGKTMSAVEVYSSRGPLHSGEYRPHLVAPGGSAGNGINSCLTNDAFGDAGYGTSYAAPHVTGLLALILEENPELSNDELRDFVIRLCTRLNGFTPNDQGEGIISLRSLAV